MKIQLLRDCDIPVEKLLHEGNGCDCSVMASAPFFKGDILDDWQLAKANITDLTYRVDYDIIEYP